LKVLHVIPSVGPLRGGPSFVIRTLTSGLAAQGISVDLVTTNDNGTECLAVPLGRPINEQGVTCWYFARQTRFYIVSLPFHQWMRRHVQDYDLIHIHAVFSYCSNAAALLASSHGVPYIVRPLGVLNEWGMRNRRPWLKKLSFRLVESRVFAGASLVHYTSEEERLQASRIGVSQRSAVIPNPVALPAEPRSHAGWFRAQYPELAARPWILFLSRIDPKKGLDILLDAFARLRAGRSRAVLMIAGDGDRRLLARLRERAHQLGIGQDIVWTGFLDGDQKAAALADADIFVLPSYSENFGIAVAEAMAYGLPVVVSDQVAIHHEITAAEAGSVVPCNADPLAAAIAKLLDSRELRCRLGVNSLRLARDCFSLPAVIGRIVETYENLLHLENTNEALRVPSH
jgi:glycosyltransferase involved in cell wall biosynthesis